MVFPFQLFVVSLFQKILKNSMKQNNHQLVKKPLSHHGYIK